MGLEDNPWIRTYKDIVTILHINAYRDGNLLTLDGYRNGYYVPVNICVHLDDDYNDDTILRSIFPYVERIDRH